MKPALGTIYEQDHLDVTVRRVLMPRTHHHVYYAVHGDELVVLSVAPPHSRSSSIRRPRSAMVLKAWRPTVQQPRSAKAASSP